MKKVFHKIISMLMAVMVLFSTMSFTVDMHYCGDTLVETAIFHKAEGCGMEMQNPTTEGCSVIKSDCCSNNQIVADGQDQLQVSLVKLSFEQQQFITSFIYSFSNLFEVVKENINSYRDYSPPLVVRELYKLDETYLI
ncbi:MAG: hypothetical protein ACI8WA_000913 [Polaribacter sp.]|jgi:hypothetical protein